MNTWAKTKPRSEIWWIEPRWSYVPELKSALAFTHGKRFWLICIALPFIAFSVLLIVVEQGFLQARENMLRGAMAILAVGLFLRYGFQFVPQILPQYVAINRHGIVRGRALTPRKQIRSVIIDIQDTNHPQLVLQRTPHKPVLSVRLLAKLVSVEPFQPERRIGIASNVSTSDLASLIRELFPEAEVRMVA